MTCIIRQCNGAVGHGGSEGQKRGNGRGPIEDRSIPRLDEEILRALLGVRPFFAVYTAKNTKVNALSL